MVVSLNLYGMNRVTLLAAQHSGKRYTLQKRKFHHRKKRKLSAHGVAFRAYGCYCRALRES